MSANHSADNVEEEKLSGWKDYIKYDPGVAVPQQGFFDLVKKAV